MDSSLPLNTHSAQHDTFQPGHAASRVVGVNPAARGNGQNMRAKYDDAQRLAECIEACVACERACSELASQVEFPNAAHSQNAAQAENASELARLARECAELCGATARLLPDLLRREFTLMSWRLNACSRVCAAHRTALEALQGSASLASSDDSIDEEARQACIDACHDCETACRALLDALNPVRHPLLSANSEWVLDRANSTS